MSSRTGRKLICGTGRKRRCILRQTIARRSEADSSEFESKMLALRREYTSSGGDALRGHTRSHTEHDG